jgi:anthranilate/para-aminobenzoate synthase component I
MLPLAPIMTITVRGRQLSLEGTPGVVDAVATGLSSRGFHVVVGDRSSAVRRVELGQQSQLWDALRAVRDAFDVPDADGSQFTFGLFGCFAYDAARAVESLPTRMPRIDNVPDVVLTIPSAHIQVDRATGEAHYVSHYAPGLFTGPSYADLQEILDAPLPGSTTLAVPEPTKVTTTMSRDEYVARGLKALDHIRNGNIFQAQLGHSVRIQTRATPDAIYGNMLRRNPSPFMYLTSMGGFTLVGASPEVFVRVENGEMSIRPIAGTIRKGSTPAEDEALAERMRSDPKELAEHIMLVDLCRNDVVSVCDPSTLAVDELLVVERYSHVSHLVSSVVGRLRDDKDSFDAVRAGIPAGTMTGAPKIRAMEIIEDLEKTPRGLYSGAVGLFDVGGYVNSALIIRSAVHRGDTYEIRASAGFVADSDPDREWRETWAKMGAPYECIAGRPFDLNGPEVQGRPAGADRAVS